MKAITNMLFHHGYKSTHKLPLGVLQKNNSVSYLN